MNILLDFIPFQYFGGVTGASSFTKAVYDSVSQRLGPQDRLFAAYDSGMPNSHHYNHSEMAGAYHAQLLDLSEKPLSAHISENRIDTFFIAIGQYYGKYPLQGIGCKVVMGIHDIWDVEREDSHVELTIRDKVAESRWGWTKRMINIYSGRYNRQQTAIYKNIIPLYAAPATVAFTVSGYTRNALKYYFKELAEKDILVCYSPARSTEMQQRVENQELGRLIGTGKPYLFQLAANRKLKNAHTLIKVYQRLLTDHPDLHLLTLKYGHSVHPQHIDITYLSDSDLQHAYKHAHALVFGSYFEGFGYPPVEAFRHGTPVVASNVTSIPEILADAAVYFSPFYPADMYRAIKTVLNDHDCRKEQISRRYAEVSRRQEADLQMLVDKIFN